MASLATPAATPTRTADAASAGPVTISVIAPTKNERHNLPRFLASLPPDVELMLCDASDDGTPDLALALRPRRTVVLTAPGSIAAARQAGAEASSGDVLVFTDADVELDAGYFDRLRAVMQPSSAYHGAPSRCAARTSFGSRAPAERKYRSAERHRSGPAPTSPRPQPSPRGRGSILPWDAVCGPKLSRNEYARYYRLVAQAQRVTYASLGIVGASGSNMVVRRTAFEALGGFRLDLRCNEDTELFLRAGRRRLRVHFDPGLVVWATDHRRLRRGLVWKSTHSLVRNVLIYLVCRRPGLPRLLIHDWGYWSPSRTPEPRHASGFDSV